MNAEQILPIQTTLHSVARKYRPAGMDLDDARQEAITAVMAQLDRFDPARGTLEAFAFKVAKNALLKRREKDGHRRLAESGFAICFCQRECDCGNENVRLRELRQHVHRLPAREQFAIRCRFFEGATLKEIATELGTTKEPVRNLIARGLRLIRKNLSR